VTPSRRSLLFASLAVMGTGLARSQALSAPNVVTISPRLVTSGQPSSLALASLRQLGFDAVICLVPNTIPDAVKEEPDLLAKQGIEFFYVPIPFNMPEEHHFLSVSAALDRLKTKKVLVHCEVNMRASSMVFLHRVIQGKEDPSQAYEAVALVWSPRGPWRRLIEAQLSKHSIKFELY
jgi:protein tyrosine phosphatase (PTP) superfamily phosphohydrolase (DUF442 family)